MNDETAGEPVDLEPYIGKSVLLGMRCVDDEATELGFFAIWGDIGGFDKNGWIALRIKGQTQNPWDGSDVIGIPPRLEMLHASEPADYSIRATGEIISNPDFTATFEVTLSPETLAQMKARQQES